MNERENAARHHACRCRVPARVAGAGMRSRDDVVHLNRECVPADGAAGNIEDLIRRRAYQIYCQRGRHPGQQIDDWLAAEREILGEIGAGGE